MDFEIYCDESCQEVLTDKKSHKYMAIGGIWIPAENRVDLKSELNKIKDKYNYRVEFKWNKVSPAFYPFYEEIIKLFFASDYIRFRCIIIEGEKVNNFKFNNGDQELGFYKFYYQLINKWILDFNNYDIFLDYKSMRDRTRLKVLKDILSKSTLTSKINQIQSLPSEQSLGIQLADLLTGIVVAKFNNEITSNAKKELIQLTEQIHGKSIVPTPKAEEKLNVFKINLQGGW